MEKHSGLLDKPLFLCYNQKSNSAERSRDMVPKGIIVRKVRASQGTVADNVSRRRLPESATERYRPQG